MGRVLAIDFGLKRTGLAVSDPMKIIASNLTTVPTPELMTWLEKYFGGEQIERVVVGYPKQMNNTPSESAVLVDAFIAKFKIKFPSVLIETYDERFTSKMASRAMLEGGLKKMDRRDKSMVDMISANLLLQSYLQYLSGNY